MNVVTVHFSSALLIERVCVCVSAEGQVLLPAHEVLVLLLAGRVRGELDRVCGVLSLHRTVSRPRMQALHREYLTS